MATRRSHPTQPWGLSPWVFVQVRLPNSHRVAQNVDMRKVGKFAASRDEFSGICGAECVHHPSRAKMMPSLSRNRSNHSRPITGEARTNVVRSPRCHPPSLTLGSTLTSPVSRSLPSHPAGRLDSSGQMAVSLPVTSMTVTTLSRPTAISRIWPSNPALKMDLGQGDTQPHTHLMSHVESTKEKPKFM